MKDLKVTTIQPGTDPRAASKSGRKEKTAGPSFDETLHNTIARVTDLKVQAGTAVDSQTPQVKNIQDEVTMAGEVFDKLMREQENLSKLYHNMKDKQES